MESTVIFFYSREKKPAKKAGDSAPVDTWAVLHVSGHFNRKKCIAPDLLHGKFLRALPPAEYTKLWHGAFEFLTEIALAAHIVPDLTGTAASSPAAAAASSSSSGTYSLRTRRSEPEIKYDPSPPVSRHIHRRPRQAQRSCAESKPQPRRKIQKQSKASTGEDIKVIAENKDEEDEKN